ncbi:MAG: hypothetical protein ACRCXZ_07455 [Patescibacteria group bacterium]
MIIPEPKVIQITKDSPEEIWWKAYDQDKKFKWMLNRDSLRANMIALERLNIILNGQHLIPSQTLSTGEEYKATITLEILNPKKISAQPKNLDSLHHWLKTKNDLKLPEDYFDFKNRKAGNGLRDSLSRYDDLVINYCNQHLLPILQSGKKDPEVNFNMLGLIGTSLGLRISSTASSMIDHTVKCQKPPKCFYYSVPFFYLRKDRVRYIFQHINGCGIMAHHSKGEEKPIRIVDQNRYVFTDEFFEGVKRASLIFTYPWNVSSLNT